MSGQPQARLRRGAVRIVVTADGGAHQFLRDRGFYTFVRWHAVMTNPPLAITEEEFREGFAIIDEDLTRLRIE